MGEEKRKPSEDTGLVSRFEKAFGGRMDVFEGEKGTREADKESQEAMLNYLKNIPMIISLIKLRFLKKILI